MIKNSIFRVNQNNDKNFPRTIKIVLNEKEFKNTFYNRGTFVRARGFYRDVYLFFALQKSIFQSIAKAGDKQIQE